jgi:hypothetical protein
MILLPYDSWRYGEATSGAFVESVAAGKFPLVSRGTWMAYELEKFGLNELVIDWKSDRLFDIIVELSASASVAEKFAVMRTAYRRFHNESCYAEHMLRIFQQAEPRAGSPAGF